MQLLLQPNAASNRQKSCEDQSKEADNASNSIYYCSLYCSLYRTQTRRRPSESP
jgi:hypothetical protein